MRLLILDASQYGERIVAHLYQHAPDSWSVLPIPAPRGLPPVVDEPEDHLPPDLPCADLILFLGESERAAQLLPAITAQTGAQAIIAPIDNARWIPPGLRGQLTRELRAMGVEIVFPEPFCSLTEDGLGAVTGEFAQRFGRPRLNVRIDPATQALAEIVVERGSPCSSTHFAAEKARGLPVTEAIPHAGLICLHYPCLASMQPEQTESGVETLMHTSGKIFNAALGEALMAAC
ncbi:MAG TPA: DUF166 family protein [Anaerolineales bacterium]|nr:DUF166 family protein [Anaerolineales bacterium]